MRVKTKTSEQICIEYLSLGCYFLYTCQVQKLLPSRPLRQSCSGHLVDLGGSEQSELVLHSTEGLVPY